MPIRLKYHGLFTILPHNHNLFDCIILIIIIIMGCGKNNVNSEIIHDSLIVLNNANDICYSKLNGAYQVSYIINEKYPANKTLKELKNRLHNKGWEPLKEDYLNPGLPSSHVRGWANFIDATQKPNFRVYQWLAQWKNKYNDILSCTLRYSYPIGGKPNMNFVTINIIYIPADIAIKRKSLVDRYLKQNEKK